MTALDAVLLVVLAASALGGYRMGLIVRAASLGGFLLGVGLSVVTIPTAVDVVAPATTTARLGTVFVTLVLTVAITSGVAQGLARSVRRAIADTPLSTLDRAGGLVAGVATTLVFVWFTAPLAGMVPGGLARAVRGSTIVAAVQEHAPDAPNPLATLQTLLSDSRFPEVFRDLAPAPVTQPPPESIPVPQTVVDRASQSAVKIETTGCGSAFSGSGWVVGDGVVVTNAHVVAGADEVVVRRPDGERLDGTVTRFDDDRDLAVVEVPGLGLPTLTFGTADDGEGAATFGHPAGQDPLRVAPARVESTINAVGRDIYGQDDTERQVVVLGASLQRGDSGSAVVDADGGVVGTVFAISPDSAGTAYALSNDEVRAVLAAPATPGDTGRCS